jgi:methylmalonyl-CoA mutase C-terminal domain/subunit
MNLMKKNKITDKLLTGGGIIPSADMQSLYKIGVGRLFGPGASTREAITYIRDWAEERSKKSQ